MVSKNIIYTVGVLTFHVNYTLPFILKDASAVGNAFYGRGTGPIHLDNVACIGTEVNILSCSYSPITSGCTHAEDASVQCSNTGKFNK